MNQLPRSPAPISPRHGGISRWAACATAILISAVLIAPHMSPRQWRVKPIPGEGNSNTALAEALAWRQGRWTLDKDFYEDAEYHGAHYNVVGLAFTIISVPVTWIAEWFDAAQAFPTPMLAALILIPIPFVTFFSIASTTRSPWWAALLTIGFLAGTPVAPCFLKSMSGDIYGINHILAVSGILLIAADLSGRRRIWPALIGLCLASWSRQMTSLYALPILYISFMDWRRSAGTNNPASGPSPGANTNAIPAPSESTDQHIGRRRCHARRFALAVAGIALIALVPMTLNAVKFGSPFESGYRYIYESHRTDPVATHARLGLFRVQNIPMHFHAMNIEHPDWDIRHGRPHLDLVDVLGGSIWLTSPLTIGVVLLIRRWWHDRERRILMAATLPVIIGLWMYHTTGSEAGFYRYALDFLPIWWLVVAPFTEWAPIARRWSIVAIAYSLIYYGVLYWT